MNRASFYRLETTAADYLQKRAPRHMWATMLAQAVEDAVKGPPLFELKQMSAADAGTFCHEIIMAAREWIADTENEPRRFVWVCEQLDLDPGAVRRELARRLEC